MRRENHALADLELPDFAADRPHSVLIRMEAVPLLSYLKDYIAGKLPTYSAPAGKFTPGTNGVGIIEAVPPLYRRHRSRHSRSASRRPQDGRA